MNRHPIACLLFTVSAALAAEPRPAIHEEYNATLQAQLPLEQGWADPPRIARTRVWWWWLNGNTDTPTITRDLEAMKAVGMGGANVIDAGGDTQEGNRRVPHGPDFGSPQWIELFRHAIAEADRLGLEMGLNIQSGWNLGGPNVPPEDSSKRVTFSRASVEGGRAVDLTLPMPQTRGGYYADVAVLAVPVVQAVDVKLSGTTASSAQAEHAADRAADGNPQTFWVSGGTEPGQGPSAQRPEWIELEFREPVMADRIEIHPRGGYGPSAGQIEASVGNQRKTLANFTGDGNRPVSIEFPKTRMERLRIVIGRFRTIRMMVPLPPQEGAGDMAP